MKYFITTIAIAGISILGIMANSSTSSKQLTEKKPAQADPSTKKIQAAILLDVSNSMDGLIDQAKAQLWNMVNTMGKATCDGKTPTIEIALYEYGRPDNGLQNGYVKQISGFTTDLDLLSQKLFSLNTNGGDEFCGKVIYTSLEELKWDTSSNDYKVIFIAGNEDFLQGNLHYTKACNIAKQKNIIVNTIYCGDKMQGIREHWNLQSECGNGSYTNINQDAKIEEIPTPYDSLMLTLNEQLNDTYVAYGYAGMAASENQKVVDKANYGLSRSVAVKRAEVKSKKGIYKNESWDMVDASDRDEKFIDKVDMKTLPDSLKNKTRAELKQIVEQKRAKRNAIQEEIGKTAVKRENYIASEKAKAANTTRVATLQSEIENIIRKQARLFNMVIQ